MSDAERPLRLFVALDLPGPVRAALAAVGAAADRDDWRALAAESLHLTLAFLGSRPPSDVDAIARVLDAEAGGPAPRLSLTGALLLPPRRPRVLTVALADLDGTLAALQAARLRRARGGRRLHAREAPVPRSHHRRPAASERSLARRRRQLALERRAVRRPDAHALPVAASPKGARYTPVTGAMLAT